MHGGSLFRVFGFADKLYASVLSALQLFVVVAGGGRECLATLFIRRQVADLLQEPLHHVAVSVTERGEERCRVSVI